MHKHLEDICELCPKTPLIGEYAPEFGAITTNGYIEFPKDYRGKWVVLFSHPGDFTPVCTTEFMTFQSMIDEFHAMNTELIGLSVDSVASHLGWIQAIKNEVSFQGWDGMQITFPIIADTGMHIASLYGMIHPNTSNTSTVRSVFIIDPRGIIRAMFHYPMTVGRNITEIKRIVIALQTSDAFRIVTPAEWIPGDDVISMPPRTTTDMQKCDRIKSKNKSSWFLSFKHISPEMILEKITNQKFLGRPEKTKESTKRKKR
ncbi:MAG: peroxiredoxin [Alphaproteobacteria bacterium]|nr:peroxiredoxin [Alphaproteobacteria bacterium]